MYLFFIFRFYQKFGMPGVVGCIDGTHIAIVKPAEFEERFFNRKRYHSLNAQIVSTCLTPLLYFFPSYKGCLEEIAFSVKADFIYIVNKVIYVNETKFFN